MNAVSQAHEKNLVDRESHASLSEIRKLYTTLTARERDVIALTVKGILNKQIAWELGITEATIKIHRRHIMDKMGAKTFLDLVRIFEKLNLTNDTVKSSDENF